MRFSATITLAFCAGALAFPTFKSVAQPKLAIRSLLSTIDSNLANLGLTVDNKVDDLVSELGLSAVDDDVDTLLSGLVGDVDSVLNDVDAIVDGLLKKLGEVEVVTTIGVFACELLLVLSCPY